VFVGAPSLRATWKDVLFLVNNENYSSAGRQVSLFHKFVGDCTLVDVVVVAFAGKFTIILE
jgi:hypothetical protein